MYNVEFEGFIVSEKGHLADECLVNILFKAIFLKKLTGVVSEGRNLFGLH